MSPAEGLAIGAIREDRCSQCNGDGKCVACYAMGVNTHLNEAEPKCRSCSGTGICPT